MQSLGRLRTVLRLLHTARFSFHHPRPQARERGLHTCSPGLKLAKRPCPKGWYPEGIGGTNTHYISLFCLNKEVLNPTQNYIQFSNEEIAIAIVTALGRTVPPAVQSHFPVWKTVRERRGPHMSSSGLKLAKRLHPRGWHPQVIGRTNTHYRVCFHCGKVSHWAKNLLLPLTAMCYTDWTCRTHKKKIVKL